MVWHARGRCRRLESVEFCSDASRQAESARINFAPNFPAVHEFTTVHAARPDAAARRLVFTRASGQAQASVCELPHAREFLEFCRAKTSTFLLSTVHADHFKVNATSSASIYFWKKHYTDVWDKRKKIHESSRNNLKPNETFSSATWSHDIRPARHAAFILRRSDRLQYAGTIAARPNRIDREASRRMRSRA